MPNKALCHGNVAARPVLEQLVQTLDSQGEGLADAVRSTGSDPIFLTVTTVDVACMHDNFVSLASRNGAAGKVVAVNLDASSHRICRGAAHALLSSPLSVVCVDLSRWYPYDEAQSRDDGTGRHARATDNAGYQSCPYHFSVFAKPLILRHVVRARSNESAVVTLIDSDVVLLADFLGWIVANRSPDAVLTTARWYGTDKPGMQWPASGFVAATRQSLPVLDMWVAECTTSRHFAGDNEELKAVFLREGNEALRARLQLVSGYVFGECDFPRARYARHQNCGLRKVERLRARQWWRPHDACCRNDTQCSSASSRTTAHR